MFCGQSVQYQRVSTINAHLGLNTLPATLLVPCDQLWWTGRHSTQGYERRRSGRWR